MEHSCRLSPLSPMTKRHRFYISELDILSPSELVEEGWKNPFEDFEAKFPKRPEDMCDICGCPAVMIREFNSPDAVPYGAQPAQKNTADERLVGKRASPKNASAIKNTKQAAVAQHGTGGSAGQSPVCGKSVDQMSEQERSSAGQSSTGQSCMRKSMSAEEPSELTRIVNLAKGELTATPAANCAGKTSDGEKAAAKTSTRRSHVSKTPGGVKDTGKPYASSPLPEVNHGTEGVMLKTSNVNPPPSGDQIANMLTCPGPAHPVSMGCVDWAHEEVDGESVNWALEKQFGAAMASRNWREALKLIERMCKPGCPNVRELKKFVETLILDTGAESDVTPPGNGMVGQDSGTSEVSGIASLRKNHSNEPGGTDLVGTMLSVNGPKDNGLPQRRSMDKAGSEKSESKKAVSEDKVSGKKRVDKAVEEDVAEEVPSKNNSALNGQTKAVHRAKEASKAVWTSKRCSRHLERNDVNLGAFDGLVRNEKERDVVIETENQISHMCSRKFYLEKIQPRERMLTTHNLLCFSRLLCHAFNNLEALSVAHMNYRLLLQSLWTRLKADDINLDEVMEYISAFVWLRSPYRKKMFRTGPNKKAVKTTAADRVKMYKDSFLKESEVLLRQIEFLFSTNKCVESEDCPNCAKQKARAERILADPNPTPEPREDLAQEAEKKAKKNAKKKAKRKAKRKANAKPEA